MPALLVLSTFPDAETARRVTRAVVEERLAACGNLVPAIESIYRWKGTLETSTEVLVLFKTTGESYSRLEARIRELHPYELPEIVAVALSGGLPGYLGWIAENCGDSK